MARYFFHTADGSRERDTTGQDLSSIAAARVAAIQFAGDCISDQPDLLAKGHDFRVEVMDQAGRLLFTIVTLAINAPAADGDI